MSSSRVRDLNNNNNTGMSFTGMGFTGSGGFRVRDLSNTGMSFDGMGFAGSGGFRVRDLNNTGMSFTGMGFTGSGGFRVRDLNNTGISFTGMGFAGSGFRDLLHFRKAVETSTQQSSTAQAAANSTSVSKLQDPIPENIGGKGFFGQSSLMVLAQELKKFSQMTSSNLDRFYDMGNAYLSYIRLGCIFVVASGCFCVGFYTLRRIQNCRGNYCGWVQRVDRLLHPITSWFSRRWTPPSAESFKALIETHIRKGELTEAEYALDRMIDRRYMPGPDLFHGVISSLLEDCNFHLASKVLMSMSELRVVGDTDLTSRVLKSLLFRGQVVKVIHHLELLIEIGAIPNLNNLIEYACEEHRSIAAWRLLEFGAVNECPRDLQISLKVLDSLLSTEDALVGYSLMVRGYITVCDRTRLDSLIELLNLKGYPVQASIISAMW